MIETTQLTYTAIITISLPDAAEPAQITVRLTPSDAITVAEGRAIPLRDCTLADLQQYAERIERAIVGEAGALRLAELADLPEARVKITLLNESDAPLPQDWSEHAVVTEPEVARGKEQGARGEGEPPAEEETEPVAAETAVADEPEPEVTVAESEPVHPEREAAEAAEAPVGPAEIRVAGRRRPVGDPTWAAVDILIDEAAFRDTQAHAITSLDREVAGVLVGPSPEKQPDGRYIVHITDTIIARHTRMHGASVTYTPESWRYLNDKLAEKYPHESAVMVGWYHTHPGFGIFLSGMDQFIHQNFFTQIWHVALVLDPLAGRSGFFCWDRSQSRVAPYEFAWPTWAAASW